MVIVAVLYAILVWLIFFKLKWLRWGWGTGTVTVILGMLLCAVFVGFLGYLAPTGRVAVISPCHRGDPERLGPDHGNLSIGEPVGESGCRAVQDRSGALRGAGADDWSPAQVSGAAAVANAAVAGE